MLREVSWNEVIRVEVNVCLWSESEFHSRTVCAGFTGIWGIIMFFKQLTKARGVATFQRGDAYA